GLRRRTIQQGCSIQAPCQRRQQQNDQQMDAHKTRLRAVSGQQSMYPGEMAWNRPMPHGGLKVVAPQPCRLYNGASSLGARQEGAWPVQPDSSIGSSEMNPTQPTRRPGMGLRRGLLGAVAVLVMPLAWATPPSFTGTPITLPFEPGNEVTVNLRQAGVITGSAAISLSSSDGVLYVTGVQDSAYQVYFSGTSGAPGGPVYLTYINDGGPVPPSGSLQVELALTNAEGSTGTLRLPVQYGPAPTVNVADPAQL